VESFLDIGHDAIPGGNLEHSANAGVGVNGLVTMNFGNGTRRRIQSRMRRTLVRSWPGIECPDNGAGMMRGIFLGMALLAASASMARAQTLLETVLYVVTILEPADNPYHRITVEQDENSIHSEFVGKTNTLQYSASVQRIADCEFAVDIRLGFFSVLYSVDFTRADLENAHPVEAPNTFGRPRHGIVIPGARYCQVSGRPYFNDIGAGACADEFVVDSGWSPKDEKMLAAIRRLRNFCSAKVS
jgi:hypothetical protein